MSKGKNQRTLDAVIFDIRREYLHWKRIYTKGCSDPNWEDGVNLNLTRGHIEYYKREIESMLGEQFIAYPDEYYWPTPPRVDDSYMAVDRKLIQSDRVLPATEREFEVTW